MEASLRMLVGFRLLGALNPPPPPPFRRNWVKPQPYALNPT